MRKNKLIELLNEIDGNPEIVTWNGYVGDWMPFNTSAKEINLHRMSKKRRLYYINLENQSRGLDLIDISQVDNEEWTMNDGCDDYLDQKRKS